MKNEKEIELLAETRNNVENTEEKANGNNGNIKLKIFGIYFTLFIIISLIFVFSPGARHFISEKINEFGHQGLNGHLVLVLIGIIILCGGFPYTTFELFLGYCLKNYPRALLVDLCSMIIGSTVCFILTKTFLKEFVQERLKRYPQLIKFKRFVEKDPWKNLILLRFIYLPIAVKQYIIPLFEVNYYQFTLSCLPASFAFGSLWIYLGMATLDLKDSITDQDVSINSKGILAVSIVLTFAILGYFAYFSRKIMKEIDQDSQTGIEMEEIKFE